MNLQIETSSLGANTTALHITGEVDVFTSTSLKLAINSAINAGTDRLVLFLSEVEYLDSTGLGVLIGALKKMREKDGSLILIGPTSRVLRIFDLTGLVSVFSIYQSLDEADSGRAVPVK